MKQNIVFMNKGAVITALLIPFFIISCGKKETAPPPPPKVKVVDVWQTTVPIPVDFVGQTYGYKDIPIRARVDGFLTGLYFTEGTVVKKGQLLYTIDPDQLKSVEATRLSGLAEARTRLVKAESDLNRIRPLAAINAVSQRDLDAAVADFEAAKARVDSEQAQVDYARINLGYTRISSPIDGIIGMTEAKVGEYVGKAPNPVVLNEVSSIDTILVNFSISEAEFLKLLRIKQAKLADTANTQESEKAKISLVLSDGSLFNQPGRFNFANRQVDPATGTILFQASFPNPDKLLRPGQFARIKVVLEEVEGGLLIPQRCVKELQGVHQVYAINANNEIELKNVKLGVKVGGMWMVESGLKAGESIVFEGLNMVRPGAKVQPEKVEIPQELKNF
ncbi:MAG: efflux RND transporter periplasmic adaptor subunit [Bacteroidales bacterium]|nr:efflux RND transporter periplasmic adaptor subunit [Bacteroidales bacterium]